MSTKNRLTLLLLLCMMITSNLSYSQSDSAAKVTIDMTYEDANGKKHSETIEYIGKEAEDFDAEAYEKSLEKRDIKILNLNINQSVSKKTKGEFQEAHDVKVKNKSEKSKKTVVIKKIITADSYGDERSMDSDTYEVEEKDGKIYMNGKEVQGAKKQIRIMKSSEGDEDMQVEVKDGKVFINGKEVEGSEISQSSESRVIVKTMKSDDDMKIEVKDGKVFINGKEVDDSEIGQLPGTKVLIKKMHGEPSEYSDHVVIDEFQEIELDSMGNTWISDSVKSNDLHKKGKRMLFISDDGETHNLGKDHEMIFMTGMSRPDAQKPRLGIMIEDGKTVNGAAIVDLVPDSPAAKAGLKKGDTVTAINGNHVYGVTSMMDKVSDFKAGEEVKVTYNRDGKSMTSTIKLEMMDTAIEKEVIIIKE